jgi:hypothetical protein
VAFPALIGEKPGAPVQNCGVAAGALGPFSTICEQVPDKTQWVPISLDAGTTTFSSADPALGDYQYLAGDNPTLLGGDQWMWSGINDVQVLAVNVREQANGQNGLFWSGVLLGLAGGAGIACVGELLRPAWKKGPEKTANSAGS